MKNNENIVISISKKGIYINDTLCTDENYNEVIEASGMTEKQALEVIETIDMFYKDLSKKALKEAFKRVSIGTTGQQIKRKISGLLL